MSSAPHPSHPGASAPARSVSPVPGSVRSQAVDRGRSVRTLGSYSQGMFHGVMSVEAFADVLGVPVKAIPLIVPTNRRCWTTNCPFDVVEGNQVRCPAHSRSWYPLENSRGGLLLGPEFLRLNVQRSHRDCDCNSASCRSAGYFPGQGALNVPSSGHETIFSTPGLLSNAKKQHILAKKGRKISLYPWHFLPEHRTKVNGTWQLIYSKSSTQKYKDREKYSYDFPPPRRSPRVFLEEEYFTSFVRPQDRWANESTQFKMPLWMMNMIAIDGSSTPANANVVAIPPSIPQLRRTIEMWKARSKYLQQQMKQQQTIHNEQLAGTKRKFELISEGLKADVNHRDVTNAKLTNEKAELERQLEEAREQLRLLRQRKGQPLRYSDMYVGGLLSKDVHSFLLFDTIEQNDAFLELINYADGDEESFPIGDGLCENLRSYSKVKMDERSGAVDPPSLDAESDDYAKYLRKRSSAMKSGISWKDDYLAFCIYVRAGTTQSFAASLVGISEGRMSDIFHEWAQILDSALCEMFPQPSRKQMLQAYPAHFIEKDGHARAYLLLDGFEIFTQQSSNVNVSSSTHSD